MKNLQMYLKKKGIDDGTDSGSTMENDPMQPADPYKMGEYEDHDHTSTDGFETEDTMNDPLEDRTGDESTKAMSNLDKYLRLKKK